MPKLVVMPNEKRNKRVATAIVIAVIALITIILESAVGSFPFAIFSFPLNILCILLWLFTLCHLYRNRATSTIAQMMLSREATWLSLLIMAVTGIALGLERKPSSDSWAVVTGILFVLSHLTFVILRGWRVAGGIRWRFTLTHVGLWLALVAGFWGAPDREQLRISVNEQPSSEAYTIKGELRRLPYDIRMEDFDIELSANGTPENYEARVNIDGISTTLRVNHPYNRTIAEKVYLVSHGTSVVGKRYLILEIVTEPWQWLSAAGIVMLIGGAVLLFLRGPKNRNS